MVIEVMHSNAVPKSLGFSLFGVGGSGASSSNSVCIGKVQIELKPLMTEAEIYQTVTVK